MLGKRAWLMAADAGKAKRAGEPRSASQQRRARTARITDAQSPCSRWRNSRMLG